jgi:hypothetical protein
MSTRGSSLAAHTQAEIERCFVCCSIKTGSMTGSSLTTKMRFGASIRIRFS